MINVLSFLVKNKFIISVIIILLLLGGIIISNNNTKKVQNQLNNAVNNIKAYSASLDIAKNQNNVFKFKIDQLNYYNDSILKKINEVRKELGIKDNKIRQMEYLLAQASRTDTITFTQVDTIFRDPTLKLDTIIGDKWYELKLGLRYPNTIIVNPLFTSEKYIMIYDKRETVNPPKKFFLFRWFQKKQIVLGVTVIEKSPYIEQKESRFIEIIK